MPDVDDVHDGYFATTAKGVPKDSDVGATRRTPQSAFERIMQNKQELLSFEEPLRFIFSHSALAEGGTTPTSSRSATCRTASRRCASASRSAAACGCR